MLGATVQLMLGAAVLLPAVRLASVNR
jgi:hypothetical protein